MRSRYFKTRHHLPRGRQVPLPMPDPTLLPSLRARDACMPSTSLALTPSHSTHVTHNTYHVDRRGGVGVEGSGEGGDVEGSRCCRGGVGSEMVRLSNWFPGRDGRGGMRLNLLREEREEASDESDGSAGARLGYPRCPKKVGRPAKPSSIVS